MVPDDVATVKGRQGIEQPGAPQSRFAFLPLRDEREVAPGVPRRRILANDA
jgi:hypothetical protein